MTGGFPNDSFCTTEDILLLDIFVFMCKNLKFNHDEKDSSNRVANTVVCILVSGKQPEGLFSRLNFIVCGY